jgi:hypothetical protein
LGEKNTCPTPPTAFGWLSIATFCTISMMRAMASPALTRIAIGVEPVCASLPVSVNSSHHRPCPWVTTPICLFSASRMGPCSM